MGGNKIIKKALCLSLSLLYCSVAAAPLPTDISSDAVSIVAPDVRSAAIMSEAGVNSNEVLLAAYGSLAAYKSEWGKLPERTLREAGWQVECHETELARFITARRVTAGEHVTLLAISGTEKKKDLLLNLKDSLVEAFDFADIKVHKGYKMIAEDINATPVMQEIVAEHARGGKLIITGHSLGGSVAILLGTGLIHAGKLDAERTSIVSFAAPDMANDTVLEGMEKFPIVNFTMKADLIPKVFHVLSGGYGRNPKNIHWEVHTPEVTFPHAMILFLDEAFYQSALTYAADIPPKGTMDVYVAVSPLHEKMNMQPDLRKAYANTVVRTSATLTPYTVYRDYMPMSKSAALEKAREHGATYLLWTEMRVLSQKESQYRTYSLSLQPHWYDLASGDLLHWTMYIFDNSEYTIFPLIIEHTNRNSWYPNSDADAIADIIASAEGIRIAES